MFKWWLNDECSLIYIYIYIYACNGIKVCLTKVAAASKGQRSSGKQFYGSLSPLDVASMYDGDVFKGHGFAHLFPFKIEY